MGAHTDQLARVPASRAQEYRRHGWWRAERIDELALRHGRERGDELALVAGDRRLTYRELDAAVSVTAQRLSALGLTRGERAVVQLPNEIEFVAVVLALARLGVAAVMALPAFREHELDHLVSMSQAAAIVVPRHGRRCDHVALGLALRERHACVRLVAVAGEDCGDLPDGAIALEGASADGRPASLAAPDDVALLLLSGGTTGLPKLIPRTHEDYGYNIRLSAEICRLDTSTTYLAALPVAHNFPLGCPGILGTLAAGGTVVLAGAPTAAHCLPLVERERVTHSALVPSLAIEWLDAARGGACDLSSLELLQVGGARLEPDAAADVCPVLGCRLQQVYGMAEGLLNFTRLDDPPQVVLETQGRPASPGDELRVVDGEGRPVPTGQTGELLVRGPYTIAGYFRVDEANRQAFTADGFYRTGDLVRRHRSGNLVVEGRVKDLINRGGEKISALELEGLAVRCPGVVDAAAVGVPDPVLGERVCLFAMLRDDRPVDLGVVRRFLQSQGLARYKLPDRLETVPTLPRTPVGKIDKAALRRQLS